MHVKFPSLPFVGMTGKQTTWQLHIILHGILTMGVAIKEEAEESVSVDADSDRPAQLK